ncbi:MAG: collagen-like protein, partial [Saprospiraceae bacterium]|nr:collagen-like protein [Saprospiraceae bacterium]
MKLLFTGLFFFSIGILFSQQGPTYQAILRKANGQINANSEIFLQFSIVENNVFGTVLYKEKQALTSDAFGWISAIVGNGSVSSGNIASINWGSGDKILLIECSTERNGNYTSLGSSIINPSYLRGIAGMAGAKGDKGEKGDQGIAGIAGAKGDKGEKGDQGIAGIAGAKGDKGDKGDQGIAGVAGAKGDKGEEGDKG